MGMYQTIDADIGYLAPMRDPPLSYSGYPAQENLVIAWKAVPVRHARSGSAAPEINVSGFTAITQKSRVSRFDQSDSWHDSFKAEIIGTLKDLTGAYEIVIPAVSIRSTASSGSFGAAHFCHNDYTSGSAARHIAGLDPSKAEGRLSRRFAAIQIWKLVSPPPQNKPLALCTSRSVAAADLVPAEARYGDPADPCIWGEMACLRYSPNHEWFYYPDLGNDEMLVWSAYDSDPGFPSIVPHTAIVDPNCPRSATPRVNVEARCYAFFD